MVEIIPKKTAKEIPLKNISLFAAAALLLAAIFSYVILLRLQASSLLAIQDLEADIFKIGDREDRAIENKVFDSENKIKDFKILWASRSRSSEFFNNFENLIHPKVWFSSFEFNPLELKVSAAGQSPDFKSLEQQLLFLKSQKDMVESVDLSEIALGNKGEVDFTLIINFMPKIFEAQAK